MLGIIHDEHTTHIELYAVAAVTIPQVKRRCLRYVQEAGIGLGAFHMVVGPGQRLTEVVCHVLVKFPVFLVADLLLRTLPQR